MIIEFLRRLFSDEYKEFRAFMTFVFVSCYILFLIAFGKDMAD